MKVDGCAVLDLGFFIDRTIHQCLQYDLTVSDTDTVLADMAKAWPAEDDRVGGALGGLGAKGRDFCSGKREGATSSNGSANGNDTNGNNSNGKSSYGIGKCGDSNSVANNGTTSPRTSYKECIHKGYISNSNSNNNNNNNNNSNGNNNSYNNNNHIIQNCHQSPKTLPNSMPKQTHHSNTDPAKLCGSVLPKSRDGLIEKNSCKTSCRGLRGCRAVHDDGRQEKGENQGDMATDHRLVVRRSFSCERLISLDSPAERRSFDACPVASVSPEINGFRPTKLKSRLQLRYQEDGDLSKAMDFTLTASVTNGSPNPDPISRDPDIGSVLNSSVISGARRQIPTQIATKRLAENPRKRRGVMSLEENVIFPKRVRREDPGGDSPRYERKYPELQLPRGFSPPEDPSLPPKMRGYSGINSEMAQYQTFPRIRSKLNQDTPLIDIRQGIFHQLRDPGDLRNPSSVLPSPHRPGFFLPTEPMPNGFRSISDRQFHPTERNCMEYYGQNHPHRQQQCVKLQGQQQQNQHHHQKHPQHNKCACGCHSLKQGQSHSQHPEYKLEKRLQHRDGLSQLIQPRDTSDFTARETMKSSLKNPMYRIASIIAEELQKDEENNNNFSQNQENYQKILQGANPLSKTWNQICKHTRCSRHHQLRNVPARSPPIADQAPRGESIRHKHLDHLNGYIPRDIIEPSPAEISGVHFSDRHFVPSPRENFPPNRDRLERRTRVLSDQDLRRAGYVLHNPRDVLPTKTTGSPTHSLCAVPASHPDVGNRLGTPPGYPYPARTVQEYPILTKPSTPREVFCRVSPASHWASGYSPPHMDSLGSISQTPPLYNMTKYSPSRETPPPSHQRPVIDSHLAPPLHKMARPSPSHETPHASPQPSAIHSHLFPPLQKRPRRPQETPPPSHQSPVNDHLAPPHHNVILPSHHPLSHLSSTPVPLYSDGVPEQDQPQDLSCKGRSTTATTTSPPSIDDDKNNMQDSPTNTNSHIPCARAPDPKTGGDVSSIYNEPEKQDLSVHPRLRPSP